MAGEHVGEQTDGQGERPQDDVRQELDRDQQDVHRHRDARDVALQLEVAEEAVLAGCRRPVVDDPDHQRQQHRDREVRGHRQLGERDELPQVHAPG